LRKIGFLFNGVEESVKGQFEWSAWQICWRLKAGWGVENRARFASDRQPAIAIPEADRNAANSTWVGSVWRGKKNFAAGESLHFQAEKITSTARYCAWAAP